jgi:RimJ/RimL family protein N-acetyltransferase
MEKILETDRLIVRKFTEADLDALYRLDSDPDVMKYISNGIPRTYEQTERSINNILQYYDSHDYGIWAIIYKPENKFIGWAGLKDLDNTDKIEIGYRFFKDYWGKGIATEASMAIRDYGFNVLGLKRIVGITNPENKGSIRVFEKIGLKFKHIARYYKTDVLYYSIERKEII